MSIIGLNARPYQLPSDAKAIAIFTDSDMDRVPVYANGVQVSEFSVGPHMVTVSHALPIPDGMTHVTVAADAVHFTAA